MFLAARTWSSRHEHTQRRDYNHRKFLPAQWSSHQNYASGVNQHSSENTSYGLDSRLDIELNFLLRIFLPIFLEDTREAFGKIMLVLMEDEALSMAMLEDEIMMVTPGLPSRKTWGGEYIFNIFPMIQILLEICFLRSETLMKTVPIFLWCCLIQPLVVLMWAGQSRGTCKTIWQEMMEWMNGSWSKANTASEVLVLVATKCERLGSR